MMLLLRGRTDSDQAAVRKTSARMRCDRAIDLRDLRRTTAVARADPRRACRPIPVRVVPLVKLKCGSPGGHIPVAPYLRPSFQIAQVYQPMPLGETAKNERGRSI